MSSPAKGLLNICTASERGEWRSCSPSANTDFRFAFHQNTFFSLDYSNRQCQKRGKCRRRRIHCSPSELFIAITHNASIAAHVIIIAPPKGRRRESGRRERGKEERRKIISLFRQISMLLDNARHIKLVTARYQHFYDGPSASERRTTDASISINNNNNNK